MVWIDFLVCLFLGMFGVHKFREKKKGLGILYLCSCGLLGFGWLYDCIRYLIAASKGNRIITDEAETMNLTENKWFRIVVAILAIGLVSSIIARNDNGTVDKGEKQPIESIGELVEATESSPHIAEWKIGWNPCLTEEIERAFSEIGENPQHIESVELANTSDSPFFVRKEYKVTFDRGEFEDILEPETWVHSRFYRITVQEWKDGEPEKDLYPHGRLMSIQFWTDDDSTNINQWAQNGAGELQDPERTEITPPNRDNIIVKYIVTVEELVKEIDSDIEAAKEKYNGKWIEITGTITYISGEGEFVGYYLYGERGKDGLKITCWVEGEESNLLKVGDEVTFIGAVREITIVNNTEIGLCAVK